VVLFQGRYEAFRGLEELVESARLLPGVLLAFRGYGSLERYLVRKVKQAGLEDRVAFFAPVEMSDLVQAAAEADVGVIPYIPTCLNNRLCTPNKLFEYMMAGLAVVASDLPELARFINQEEVGALFDPTSPE